MHERKEKQSASPAKPVLNRFLLMAGATTNASLKIEQNCLIAFFTRGPVLFYSNYKIYF